VTYLTPNTPVQGANLLQENFYECTTHGKSGSR
jgi:hypothetical protein